MAARFEQHINSYQATGTEVRIRIVGIVVVHVDLRISRVPVGVRDVAGFFDRIFSDPWMPQHFHVYRFARKRILLKRKDLCASHDFS